MGQTLHQYITIIIIIIFLGGHYISIIMIRLGLCLFMGYIVLVTADIKGSDNDRNIEPVKKENLEDLQIFTLRESGTKGNTPKKKKKKRDRQKIKNGIKSNGNSHKEKKTKKKLEKRKNNLKRKKIKNQRK